MKTTKKQFRDFCKAFKKWQVILNCNDWDMTFACKELEDCFACINTDAENSRATLLVATIRGKHDLTYFQAAKHEAMHLLLARYAAMALNRHCGEKELNDEEERLVRLLCRLIPDDVDITKLKELPIE